MKSSFACHRTELDLNRTLNCGQSFRWSKNTEGKWIGVLAEKLWFLWQSSENLHFQVIDPVCNPCISSEATTAHKNVLAQYFQLDVDLRSLYHQWKEADPNFARISNKFPGIRILMQDPVENVFAFICSSNNNIQRISSMVEKLCSNYGTHLVDFEGAAYHSFPTIERLAEPSVESELRKLGFGYRAKFLSKAAKAILAKGGKEWLMSLRNVSYEEAKLNLMQLPGIGAKVADCVCLMSLGHLNAIPVDTHMFQIAQKSYLPHLKKHKTITTKAYAEISLHFQTLYGSHAGWAHSVLFSADLRHLQLSEDIHKDQPPKKKKK